MKSGVRIYIYIFKYVYEAMEVSEGIMVHSPVKGSTCPESTRKSFLLQENNVQP